MLTKKTASSRKRIRKTAVGIVGCGAIGTELAKAIDRGFIQGAFLIGLSDRERPLAEELSRKCRRSVPILTLDKLIERSDLIIESAHVSVVPGLLKKAIQKRKNLLIMSSGGILGKETLLQKARKAGCRISFPSGALFGIDGIKASALMPLQRVTLVTRKPPRSFEGAPFVLKRRIRLSSIRRPRLLFRGDVKKALAAFPQNINVAATLELAGVDRRKLEVQIIADPSTKRNSHEITLEGSLGKLTARAENIPSRRNPRTSRLAILSALAALKSFFDPVRIGT